MCVSNDLCVYTCDARQQQRTTVPRRWKCLAFGIHWICMWCRALLFLFLLFGCLIRGFSCLLLSFSLTLTRIITANSGLVESCAIKWKKKETKTFHEEGQNRCIHTLFRTHAFSLCCPFVVCLESYAATKQSHILRWISRVILKSNIQFEDVTCVRWFVLWCFSLDAFKVYNQPPKITFSVINLRANTTNRVWFEDNLNGARDIWI